MELLFDLVFVFAITSLTGTLAHHLSGQGLFEGLVLMALLWFGWAANTWLGNQARGDEGPLRVALIFAMAGYFVMALAIPEAFDDRPGGLDGPVVFVVAYAVVRYAHLGIVVAVMAGLLTYEVVRFRDVRRAVRPPGVDSGEEQTRATYNLP
ncbi:MAG: low temperature requirement protein A [Nocardioidaceae bacterium]